MSPLLSVLVVLLIPAGLLPVATAWILRRYRHQPSGSLRDRWHLSIVLAVLGVVVAFLAANRVFEWQLQGEVVAIPLSVVLLAVDLISGAWLFDYFSGRYDLPDPDTPEEVIERAASKARQLVRQAAEETARDLVRAELENPSRATLAAEQTADDQKRSADAAERTADAAERTAENTEPA